MRTSAPSRAAPTAWFAPLPPGIRSSVAPVSVSPGRGSRSTCATRSRLIEPTTASSGGKGAQVARGPLEVLAQVEQPRPERGAIGHRVDPGHVGETVERTDEHRALEVRLRDARGTHADSRTLQDRSPLDQLAGTGTPVPRPSFRTIRL